MKSTIETYLDEIDAVAAAEKFISAAMPRHRPTQVERFDTFKSGIGLMIDGGVTCIWGEGRLVALAVVVRDDANHAVLTTVSLSPKPTGQERRRLRREKEDAAPVMAYVCAQEGYSECYVAAKSPAKARWTAVKSMLEMGMCQMDHFRNIRVSRVSDFDQWAKGAKVGKCYTIDAIRSGEH